MGLRGKDHWLAVRQAFADDAASRIEDAAKLTAHERIMLGLRMGALSRSASEPVDESEHAALIIHRRWRALQERRRAAGA